MLIGSDVDWGYATLSSPGSRAPLWVAAALVAAALTQALRVG
jgi:hypothetical protein